MTIISFFGVLLGLLAIPVMLRGETMQRYAIAVALAAVHLAALTVYYFYTKSNLADAYFYYYSDAYYASVSWTSLSSAFVGRLTQFLKHNMGATYLDCFMVFQAFGFWGLILLMRVFREISWKTRTREQLLPIYLLFLPSVHFWTVAIGKDGPVFLSVALCVWAMLQPSKRIGSFLFSIAMMVAFRAHIALAAAMALALALLLEKYISSGRKVLLLGFSVIALLLLVSAVQSSFNIDVTSADSVSQFMQGRQVEEVSDSSTSSKLAASFLVRLISLLFRPFFFDAKSVFGLASSVENVGSVLLFGYFIFHFGDFMRLAKQVLFVRFNLVFALILIAVLSILNYNVGLGVRERVMLYPPLFSLFVATYGYRLLTAASARAQPFRSRIPVAEPKLPDARLPTT